MPRTPPDAVWSSHMPLCTVEPLSVEGRPAGSGSPFERHEGRVLDLTTLGAHENCRGSAPVAVGHGTARGHVIDARTIGEAARSGRYEPPPLTQLWHLAARWGRPRS